MPSRVSSRRLLTWTTSVSFFFDRTIFHPQRPSHPGRTSTYQSGDRTRKTLTRYEGKEKKTGDLRLRERCQGAEGGGRGRLIPVLEDLVHPTVTTLPRGVKRTGKGESHLPYPLRDPGLLDSDCPTLGPRDEYPLTGGTGSPKRPSWTYDDVCSRNIGLNDFPPGTSKNGTVDVPHSPNTLSRGTHNNVSTGGASSTQTVGVGRVSTHRRED